MRNKIIKVGIFWVIPDKDFGQSVLEVCKSYCDNEADKNGFINYPYSHYEVWDEEVKGLGGDCYKYPRGRVIYDAKNNKHLIYADKCVSPSAIDEVVELFEIENYRICRDEHYVCSFCDRRKRATLEYKVLRGKDRIGANLIEVSYGGTKILVELGKALDGSGETLEREILDKPYSAVVVSHYHEDHAGLIRQKRNCPVYTGQGAYRIIKAIGDYRGKEMPTNIKKYYNCKPFVVGQIKITPFLCDHSAYDSYMLLFEEGGKSILYTGDFRFHGRKDKDKLLSALPKSVDVLIHEGTNIGKNSYTFSEAELESKAVEIMKSTKSPVFVLQSGTNIDRLVSIFRASKRSGRITYMDNYTSLIASAAGGSIPRPDVFKDVIAFTPRRVRGKRGESFLKINNKRGLNRIAKGTKRFTMLVRPSMCEYIRKLVSAAHIGGATLIYSMWKGYKENEATAEFLSEMRALGLNIIDLHTSGHASAEDIELLKQTVNAKQTVCVHTEMKKRLNVWNYRYMVDLIKGDISEM